MPSEYADALLAEQSPDSLPAPLFLSPTKTELRYEKRQCLDEGRDVSSLASEFDALLGSEEVTAEEVNAMLDASRDLPFRSDYEYHEPSALDDIRASRPDGPRQLERSITDLADPFDTVYGGWLGACAGCLLGKPVQGWSREHIVGFLRASDQYPLNGYIRSDVADDVAEAYDIYRNIETTTEAESSFIDDVSHMPIDDDIDYVFVGLGIVEEYGESFEPVDIANYWLENIPAFYTYTAERIAYRNFMNLISPPESAVHRNPYREHVGAMIRADMWGYLSPGDLERAAAFAWRDGTISHTKNGIYGEMWAAAMIAAAPFEHNPRTLLELGLTQIPADSRLAEAVTDVIDWYGAEVEYGTAVERVHDRWDEGDQFEWVHTISNAQVMAVALLWGDGNFGDTLCHAVQAGFDTDSHGATLGSILGLMTGADDIPPKWTDPLSDRVDTSLVDYRHQRISDVAERTLELARELDA